MPEPTFCRFAIGVLASCFALIPSATAQHFTTCLSAPSNATILIPDDVSSSVGAENAPLEVGDEIAVFTNDGDCAGVGRWSETSLVIAAAGTHSQDTDGYEPDESFQFRIWDASAETAYTATVTYQTCDGGVPLCRSDGRYQTNLLYTLSNLVTEEVLDPQDGGLTVTQVSASTEQDPNVAAHTLDADLSTRWSTYGRGEWIQHELSAETTLDQIGIAWYRGSERQAQFEVALSTDGTTWTTVHEGSSGGTTRNREYYSFSSAPARFVRITGYGNTENDWNAITEVDIAGTNDGSNSKVLARSIAQPIEETIPKAVILDPNYPNPFRTSTIIRYALPQRSHVILDVFNVVGQRVARLVDRSEPAGQHEVLLTPEQWSSGTYIYRLRVGSETRTGRMTLVR